MKPSRAYNELVSVLLSEEDREKFEWAIGAMLSNGPRNIVVIRGAAGSGKTTLTNIVRMIVLSPISQSAEYFPRVAFVNWDHRYEFPEFGDEFVFTEALSAEHTGDALVINTTGDRVPVNKHYVLTRQLDSELIDIATVCVNRYRSLGEGYYGTPEAIR